MEIHQHPKAKYYMENLNLVDRKESPGSCAKCHKGLTPEATWLPDAVDDRRVYCYDCAPEDAIRAKDTI